jgi:hypothetical protein
MPAVDLATRLTPYGLKAADVAPALVNLTVPAGQKIVLTRQDHTLASHIRQLQPTQLADLKLMIGVPDKAVARPPKVTGRPAVFSSQITPQITLAQHVSLWNTGRQAILGNSASLSATDLSSVNQWIKTINPIIVIILFQDITIETGGILVLGGDLHVLFANNISIQHQGQILVSQATIAKIDCASLTGVDGPAAGTSTGTQFIPEGPGTPQSP